MAPLTINAQQLQLRQRSGHEHHHMNITPTRFQWNKFKDMIHFYVMLGGLPITAIVLYCNIFIGPVTLTEMPEDDEPKHWECYKHSISRFIARYMYPSQQETYEKALHHIYEKND